MHHRRRAKARGRAPAYIMLEALIGGALLATVLLGLVGQIGEARAESTRQSRRITAQQLLMRELEELRALPFSAVSTNVTIAGIGAGDRSINVGNGRYRVQRVVSANQTETVQTSGPISVTYRTVTVTVSFPDRVGDERVVGLTRIYSEDGSGSGGNGGGGGGNGGGGNGGGGNGGGGGGGTGTGGGAGGTTMDPGSVGDPGGSTGGPSGGGGGSTGGPPGGDPGCVNCNCFVAGTEVATPDGPRLIESLAVGDRVLGVGVTGGLPEDERRVAAVLHTFERDSDHVRVLDIGDEEIRTTDEHPFFVMGQGFKKAGELQPGDRLVALSGTRVVVSSTRIEGSFAVFNIEVDGVNDYFVSSAGVLVHNKQAPPPPQPPDP